MLYVDYTSTKIIRKKYIYKKEISSSGKFDSIYPEDHQSIVSFAE